MQNQFVPKKSKICTTANAENGEGVNKGAGTRIPK